MPDHKPTDQVHGYNSCIFDVFKRSLDALISLVSITSLFPTAIQMVPTGFSAVPSRTSNTGYGHTYIDHHTIQQTLNHFFDYLLAYRPMLLQGFGFYIQPLLFAFIAVRNIASLKILGATCDTRYSVCKIATGTTFCCTQSKALL